MLRYDIRSGVKKIKTKTFLAISALGLGAAGFAGSMAILGSAHAAPPPNWSLNAPSPLTFYCLGTNTPFAHTLLTVSNHTDGSFTGTGEYDADHAYTWNASGNISGDDFSMTVTYTGTQSGYIYNLVNGVIHSDGSISGNVNDVNNNCQTFSMPAGSAQSNTLYVQPTNTTVTGQGSCSQPNYNTVQGAVNAANPGDVIHVCAGTYPENVTINPPVTLLGNNAGISGTSGSRGAESVITGIVTVNDPNVTIDGFTVDGQNTRAYGVEINPAASNMVLTNNIIDNFDSASDSAQAVYLVHGPDGTRVTRNSIHDVHGKLSTKGVFIGDSNTTDPSNNVVIRNNAIYNVTSDSKGAYAITINNGSNPVGTTHNTGLVIRNNNISNLTGGWVHAIGLEADTPGAVVKHNTIQGLNAASPDNIGVWLENTDPSHASVKVNRNNFLFTNAFGIAVHPGFTSDTLDGTCNYWDSNTGPSGVGSGSGAPVTSLVSYQPWLIAKNGDCVGGTKPKSKNDCKDNGWQYLVNENNSFFKNQGQCVSWVEHNVLHHGDKDKEHDHDEDVFWQGHHYFF